MYFMPYYAFVTPHHVEGHNLLTIHHQPHKDHEHPCRLCVAYMYEGEYVEGLNVTITTRDSLVAISKDVILNDHDVVVRVRSHGLKPFEQILYADDMFNYKHIEISAQYRQE